jgi:hypothetical protein
MKPRRSTYRLSKLAEPSLLDALTRNEQKKLTASVYVDPFEGRAPLNSL